MKSITEEVFIRRKFYNKKENESKIISLQIMKACQDDLNAKIDENYNQILHSEIR